MPKSSTGEPECRRAEIADLDNFEQHVARFLALIPRDSSTFDLQLLVKCLVSAPNNPLEAKPTTSVIFPQFLDTSTEFLFGQSIESLLPQTPFDTAEFMEVFDYSLLGLALRLIAGPLKFLFIFDPTWKKAYTKAHAFVDKRVSIALDRQRSKAKTGSNSSSGNADKHILLHEMAAETQDPYELRAQILNVFFPARDTAAIAFGNIIFEIIRNPHIWEELRAEVLSIGSQQITFELLKSLKTTRAIINETLRLHLPASRISRTALRDTILPVGGGSDGRSPLFMPKGQVVEMDLYTLQRSPEIWGDDANEFKPHRWSEGQPLWEAKWHYQPFLGGM